MNRSAQAMVAGLLVLACAGAGVARAERTIEIESKAGFGFSKLTGDNPGGKQKNGFSGAIAVGVPLSEWFSLQPEVTYAMKGTSWGQVTDPDIGGTVYAGTFEQLYSMDYLELPVLLRVRRPGNSVRPALIAGPVVGWKVVEKFTLNGPGSADPYGSGESMRAVDFGFVGGLGIELGPTDQCFTMEARYTGGLSNVLKPEYGEQLRNVDFRFQLGWRKAWAP